MRRPFLVLWRIFVTFPYVAKKSRTSKWKWPDAVESQFTSPSRHLWKQDRFSAMLEDITGSSYMKFYANNILNIFSPDRLCEKWTFSLCSELNFPNVDFLLENNIHGPVDIAWAREKLMRKSDQRYYKQVYNINGKMEYL